MTSLQKLDLPFYLRDDVVTVARDLIGKYVFTEFEGELTGGMIVETEAYNGRTDKACHAYRRRTPRTEVMYDRGGVAYIYLCYGIHHMLNIVTNTEGLADAVLVRAIQPVEGLETMIARRGKDLGYKLTAGPGALGKALAVHKDMTGVSLLGGEIWLARDTETKESHKILVDRRVGVDYAGNDALLPWRFFIENSPWVSKKKQKEIHVIT